MPGGSVNGRPFRESRDAYSRTGIPCGNPRRFHSQDVVRVEPGFKTRSRPIDGPLEEIETEGQRQLQAILQKQLDTNATVKQQLGQKREFAKGVEYNADTEELAGVRSLSDYQTQGEVDAYIEEMKSYGLTLEEILFKMQSEEEESVVGKKSRLSNPEFHKAKLQEINEKIAQKKEKLNQPDKFSNVKPISRHEMELEMAISNANPQNRFLHSTLVQQKTNRFTSSYSATNAVTEVLDSINQRTSNSGRQKDKKGLKNKDCHGGYKDVCNLECCVAVEAEKCAHCGGRKSSNRSHDKETWSCDQGTRSHDQKSRSCSHGYESGDQGNGSDDCKSCGKGTGSCDLEEKLCDCEMAVATCMERPPDYVSKDEQEKGSGGKKNGPQKSTSFIVQTKRNTNSICPYGLHSNLGEMSDVIDSDFYREIDYVEPVPEESITRYKLSAEDVKKIPRFENYTPGEPNNVLFVKNLSSKVTEEDLASLFTGFHSDTCERIIFKLLNGKMKGQAFVTFPDEVTASRALELVHGYEFKGKPVIIQYGKKKSSST